MPFAPVAMPFAAALHLSPPSSSSSIGLSELCLTDVFSYTGNEIKVIRRIGNNVLFACLRLNERIIFNITWILHVFKHVHAIWIYHYCGFICFQLRVHGGSIHNVVYIITSGWIYIILHKK
jgi:hypothetical protein